MSRKAKCSKEIESLQQKAKDILTKMEEYAKTHKSTGVVAFAQFQSMTGQEKFIRAINRTGWCARLCSKKHDYKYLKGKWLSVKKGPEPTVINWSNL